MTDVSTPGDDFRLLAQEQAALRRVATLIAGAADPSTVFDLVTREASQLLGLPVLTLVRFEADATATVVAAATDRPFPVGTALALDGPSVIAAIYETGQSARVDSYDRLSGGVAAGLRSAGAEAGYGVPVKVHGNIWGAMAAVHTAAALADDAEDKLASFTDLVAAAISNAQAHDDLARLAQEQTSLRRVATLVARESANEGFFSVVAAEIRRLFDAWEVAIVRFEQRNIEVVGAAGGNPLGISADRWSLDGDSVCAQIVDSGLPTRVDVHQRLGGLVDEATQEAGITSEAGAPIISDGRIWGAIMVACSDRLPDRSEQRVAEFTDLVATAISNSTTRTELIASRARLVTASDEALRRIERDLHDGVQQRLIALSLDLQTHRALLSAEGPPPYDGLDRIQNDLQSVLEEIGEISRGLHPALLARRGLRPALQALARRSPIPVELHVGAPRAPQSIEVATYYAVSEMLTNAIKHSRASVITIEVAITDAMVRATIQDDGVGGAVVGDGTGLSGLIDRAEALGGTLAILSGPSAGTRVVFELPSVLAAR